MRIARALAPLVAVCASLFASAIPAAAADSPVTMTLTERWETPGLQANWNPYVATVRNDGASDFTGLIYLSPIDSRNVPVRGYFPDYRAQVTVPKGTSRSVTFYVFQPPAGYQAELRDGSGHTVVSGVATQTLGNGFAVAVLSDQPQGDQRIQALKPMPDNNVRFSRFASAQAFPTNAVYLSGLQAVVIDDFDTNSLSEAQMRALRDFVGLGGSLVVAAGSAWRRTLLPLSDRDFGPFKPVASDQASIRSLGDLVNRPSDLLVPVVSGTVTRGTVLVGDAKPLIVEGVYGAGRIVELLFDPLAEPLSTADGGLASLAWTVAMDRALLTQAVPVAGGKLGAPVTGPGVPAVPGGAASGDELFSILNNTPAGTVPPVGLIGGLLVLYILLAGPVNYAALKGMRRRELMWVTVPAVAIAFTTTAYLAGLGQRGVAFLDSEIQVVRLAPDGAAQVEAYHGIFTPRRGDFTVALPANTIATTALGSFGVAPGTESAVVDAGSKPRVEMKGSAYDSMRTLHTLTVARPPAQPATGVEAHLRLVNGHIVGTIRNSGDRPLQQLVLVSGLGQQAVLAADLGPKATAAVDATLDAASQRVYDAGAPGAGKDYRRSAVLRIAVGQAIDGRQGMFSLIGLTESYGGLQVEGTQAARASVAAIVVPVALESADALSGIALRPELVAQNDASPYHYAVYDMKIPAGYSGGVKVQYIAYPASANPALNYQFPVKSVEVYDWTSGSWRALAQAPAGSSRALNVDLQAGELLGGVVRVRALEQSLGAVNQNLMLVAP
jgi:hypothetical protein